MVLKVVPGGEVRTGQAWRPGRHYRGPAPGRRPRGARRAGCLRASPATTTTSTPTAPKNAKVQLVAHVIITRIRWSCWSGEEAVDRVAEIGVLKGETEQRDGFGVVAGCPA
jgi:hypothetical protein